MKHFSLHLYCFSFFIFTAISCNAQTFTEPKLQTPTYHRLINTSNFTTAAIQLTLLDSSPISYMQEIPSKDAGYVPNLDKKMDLWKVSTISPTHYADTHNAFFCRLERKVNKKFIMPVRVRLEGF
ncbi:MAG: hypothetical protein R3E32_07765 [Chitinophagales bacterium]